MAARTKTAFQNFQALRIGIDGYDDYLDELGTSFKTFLEKTNQHVHNT